MKNSQFIHLNVHSHYSIMDGCAGIKEMVDAAVEDGMQGMAITDSGNMYGVMEFFDHISYINTKRQAVGISRFKPIIGCELCMTQGTKDEKDYGENSKAYRLTVLAKNYQGYKNLIKIVSDSWTNNDVYMAPQANRQDLERHHEGLIVLSGGEFSEVYTHIVSNKMDRLDETIKWYRQVFGDDYYLELQRNYDGDSVCNVLYDSWLNAQKVNVILIKKGREFGVKLVATNDVRYLRPNDKSAYNALQCDAKFKTMAQLTAQNPPSSRWLRSGKEMCELFADLPEAIASTIEIYDKVEFYDIHHAPMIPSIDIPKGFGDDKKSKEDDYLEYLSFSGAKQIYGDVLPEEVSDRLEYELQIIAERKVAAYFLFMQDVVNAAKSELGVWMSPGCCIEAGCLVCYCLGITKIDPLEYGLHFEEFIRTEGMIYIGINVDEEGRERIFTWLEQKYGKDCCAHVVLFDTFIADEAFTLVTRVNRLQTLETMAIREAIMHREVDGFRSIKDIINSDSRIRDAMRKVRMSLGKTIEDTSILEGNTREACVDPFGFVVANEPIVNWCPISVASEIDSDSDDNDIFKRCTQYDS